MNRSRSHVVLLGVVVALTIILFTWALVSHAPAVFHPRGVIASKQRDLMVFALGLSLLVIVPVFAMLFGFAWKYRAGNKKATYQPNWANSRKAETIWWGVPLILITILSVVAWRSSHSLDPTVALESNKSPLTVQVVALQWKWLFIYPDERVAAVNEVAFPVDRPVRFQITSDAPMNSFWIPELGGQIYAMSGMSTTLNLMADRVGDYRGVSANLSGEGFSGMHFTAKAMTDTDYKVWIQAAHNAKDSLDETTYAELAKATKDVPVNYYWSVESTLYDRIIGKYDSHEGSYMKHNMTMEAN